MSVYRHLDDMYGDTDSLSREDILKLLTAPGSGGLWPESLYSAPREQLIEVLARRHAPLTEEQKRESEKLNEQINKRYASMSPEEMSAEIKKFTRSYETFARNVVDAAFPSPRQQSNARGWLVGLAVALLLVALLVWFDRLR